MNELMGWNRIQNGAKSKTFTVKTRKKVLDFLTELGPNRVIAMTTTSYYGNERVTVWYWAAKD